MYVCLCVERRISLSFEPILFFFEVKLSKGPGKVNDYFKVPPHLQEKINLERILKISKSALKPLGVKQNILDL